MRILPNSRYILLDAFRGISILWIVCFHVLKDVREQYIFILDFIISYGHLGVQIFFVISGYGIAVSVDSRYQKPLTFLLFRLRRIYLPYWWHLLFALLIIPLVTSIISMFKTKSLDVFFHNYGYLELFKIATLTKVFFAKSWKLNEAFLPLNGVVWYIAIIVQIYIFITVCLYTPKKMIRILILVFIISLITNIPFIYNYIPYGLFLPYFSHFFIGILVYHILRNNLVPKRMFFKIFIIFLFAIAVYFCSYYSRSISVLQLLFSFLIGSIILVLHKYDNKLSILFVIKPFILLGTFSYSLYLLHCPLWPLVGMFVKNLVPLPNYLSAPFFLVPGIIVLSFFWYLFFEKVSLKTHSKG